MFLSFVAIAIHFLLLSVGFVVVHAPALPAIIRFRPVAVRHCCHHNIASHAEYCMIESTALILGIFILSPFNNKMKNCAKKKKRIKLSILCSHEIAWVPLCSCHSIAQIETRTRGWRSEKWDWSVTAGDDNREIWKENALFKGMIMRLSNCERWKWCKMSANADK